MWSTCPGVGSSGRTRPLRRSWRCVSTTASAPNPPRGDVFGLLSGGLGLALIYAALDQGNRLDWLNSGLVWGLLLAGAILLVGFLVHEARIANPLVNFKVAFAAPLPKLLVLVAL